MTTLKNYTSTGTKSEIRAHMKSLGETARHPGVFSVEKREALAGELYCVHLVPTQIKKRPR